MPMSALFSRTFSRTLLTRHSVLPGFDLALGFTLLYLSFIVLIPISAAFLKTATMSCRPRPTAASRPPGAASLGAGAA